MSPLSTQRLGGPTYGLTPPAQVRRKAASRKMIFMAAKAYAGSVVIVLLCTRLVCAGGSVRDLIPAGAAAAVGVSSIEELKKKGDRFYAAAGLQGTDRPSRLAEMALDFLGVKEGLDKGDSFALVLADPEILGIQLWTPDGKPNLGENRIMDLLVVVAPVRDRDAFAGNFGIKKGELKPDVVVGGKGKILGQFFYAHGDHVFFGNHATVVRRVARDPRAGAELTPASRRTVDQADILVHLNTRALAPFIKDMLTGMEKDLRKQAPDGNDGIIRQFIGTLAAIETTWIGVRVDEGLGFSWINTFSSSADKSARDFLRALQSGSSGADLVALPEGRVVLAQAFRGNGSETGSLLRMVYAWLARNTVETRGLLIPLERDNYLGILGEFWKYLRGSRFALYANADRLKHGLFSAVAILDIDRPETFLAELRQLARFAAAVDDTEAARKDLLPALKDLVDKLGSNRYAERESAAVRLRLIGEPALPYLDRAAESPEPEVRRRASLIKERIIAVAQQRRKELLSAEALRPVHVLLGFSRPETLDGQHVDVVKIKLSEPRAAGILRDLLGPDGDRIRLAVHGKQVVVLLGSDQDLLRAALRNLKEGKKGLVDAKTVVLAQKQLHPGRAVEFDVSLAAVLALWNAADLRRPGELPGPLTSFALTASPELLQFDVWLPAVDFKIVQKALFGF